MIQYMQLGANGLQCLHVHIAKAILTDIGTEELAHMEMIAALVYKLVDGATCEEFKEAGWEGQFAQHDHGLFWTDANGVPWSAKYIACLGDPITDLTEDMAADGAIM
ncbi:putative manganese catalase [Sporomusa ovata DSM 2662]|nr:manganese catalase family protein [Sporomusa ovata]EQB27434.1 Mn-containing catalase [Sporomusa ovata DSM 2662]